MILVNMLGLMLIAGIVWWFWLYKPSEADDRSGKVIVVENGVYSPSGLVIKEGVKTSLVFFRKDASPCAGTVLFPALDISEELPLNKEKTILIPPLKSGTYVFSCQMQMYRGELFVKK